MFGRSSKTATAQLSVTADFITSERFEGTTLAADFPMVLCSV